MTEPKKINLKRVPTREQEAGARVRNFNEVNYGYDMEEAKQEAGRCLLCKKPLCVGGCPVAIDIPGFIAEVAKGDMHKAYEVLTGANVLPAVCGRVCPQETQCEERCVLAKKGEAVNVGKLERFVGDWAIKQGLAGKAVKPEPKGKKSAIIGSGPAAISCAHDLARAGVDVTIYEALHTAGGVLKYGIPNFRLPNEVIDIELEKLNKLGVKIELNKVVGRIFTIPDLLDKMGFDTVFVCTGAGAPKFMGVEGEGLNGMMSSNEFLTRVNLMEAYKFPEVDTPVVVGKKVAVIGGGNTAMDSVRTAKRLGAESAMIVYRRTEKEAPARVEEIHHAKEEGIEFYWLTAPVKILGDNDGWVKGMECLKMELGPADESGRRRPVEVKGSNFVMDADMIICALGTGANPIIAQTTPGLKINKWGNIEANDETQATSLPRVYAGGDIVTGGATVISAMGAGRRAAAAMLKEMGL